MLESLKRLSPFSAKAPERPETKKNRRWRQKDHRHSDPRHPDHSDRSDRYGKQRESKGGSDEGAALPPSSQEIEAMAQQMSQIPYYKDHNIGFSYRPDDQEIVVHMQNGQGEAIQRLSPMAFKRLFQHASKDAKELCDGGLINIDC